MHKFVQGGTSGGIVIVKVLTSLETTSEFEGGSDKRRCSILDAFVSVRESLSYCL
jgi:hypothetical protein